MQTHSLGNILRVVPIDPEGDGVDFVDEDGFFIRAGTTGYLRYCPMNNKSDAEAIEKTFTASDIFIDPELCRKVFHDVTGQNSMASDIYVGYGV